MTSMHRWGADSTFYNMQFDYVVHRVVDQLFARGDAFVAMDNVPTLMDPQLLLQQDSRPWKVRYIGNSNDGSLYLLADAGTLIVACTLNRRAANLAIHVFSPTMIDSAQDVLAALKALAPAPPAPPEGLVAVRFWTSTPHGPVQRRRELTASRWEEVKSNYGAVPRAALDKMMSWEQPPNGGRLLLLHGEPGGGKTHAIRALAREWGRNCEVHYIVDPDKFFGSAAYMLSVLLDDNAPSPEPTWDEEVVFEEPVLPWRLIVVEDADELLRLDAKERTGQAMSRLLNVCDGLVGQGLRLLILITTNEPLASMHPAVIRPGRCLANIEVGRLSAAESSAWLGQRTSEEMSLAELYEARAKVHVETESAPIRQGIYV